VASIIRCQLKKDTSQLLVIMSRQPAKRGISDRQLFDTQDNCVAIIGDSSKHDRTRRLYQKQVSGSENDNGKSISMKAPNRGRRQGFCLRSTNSTHRDSMVSTLSCSTNSTDSSKIDRIRHRRDNAKKNKLRSVGKGKSAKSLQNVIEEEEDPTPTPPPPVSPINPYEHPQYPYGYPPPMPPPGMHPGMMHPGMMHPGYYMQPPPVQPQIVMMAQPPGAWFPGQQQQQSQDMTNPQQQGSTSPGMTEQQYKDQQLINKQQQDIIRQQQELQQQQQDQLQRQQAQLLKQQQQQQQQQQNTSNAKFMLNQSSNPSPPAATPVPVAPPELPKSEAKKGVTKPTPSNPILSADFIDQLKDKLGDQATKVRRSSSFGKDKSKKGKPDRTRTSTAGSDDARESTASSSAKSTSRNTDDFTVGILGIGDISVLEKTIGLLKKNSFSDKFNPEKNEAAKPRGGMHGSFVEKTRDGLNKRPSDRKLSQVLSKTNVRLERRESLELDFNDVYSTKKESFTVQSGLLDNSKMPPKSFKRQDSNGSRNFAFENPNFSHN
jgi:hypothetical protein